MIVLHVALQDGFVNDSVVVLLGDKEIYHKDAVTTRTQISLADSVEFNSPESQVNVKVDLPARNLSRSIPVDLSRTPYLGISISPEGQIAHQLQSEPFGYV